MSEKGSSHDFLVEILPTQALRISGIAYNIPPGTRIACQYVSGNQPVIIKDAASKTYFRERYLLKTQKRSKGSDFHSEFSFTVIPTDKMSFCLANLRLETIEKGEIRVDRTMILFGPEQRAAPARTVVARMKSEPWQFPSSESSAFGGKPPAAAEVDVMHMDLPVKIAKHRQLRLQFLTYDLPVGSTLLLERVIPEKDGVPINDGRHLLINGSMNRGMASVYAHPQKKAQITNDLADFCLKSPDPDKAVYAKLRVRCIDPDTGFEMIQKRMVLHGPTLEELNEQTLEEQLRLPGTVALEITEVNRDDFKDIITGHLRVAGAESKTSAPIRAKKRVGATASKGVRMKTEEKILVGAKASDRNEGKLFVGGRILSKFFKEGETVEVHARPLQNGAAPVTGIAFTQPHGGKANLMVYACELDASATEPWAITVKAKSGAFEGTKEYVPKPELVATGEMPVPAQAALVSKTRDLESTTPVNPRAAAVMAQASTMVDDELQTQVNDDLAREGEVPDVSVNFSEAGNRYGAAVPRNERRSGDRRQNHVAVANERRSGSDRRFSEQFFDAPSENAGDPVPLPGNQPDDPWFTAETTIAPPEESLLKSEEATGMSAEENAVLDSLAPMGDSDDLESTGESNLPPDIEDDLANLSSDELADIDLEDEGLDDELAAFDRSLGDQEPASEDEPLSHDESDAYFANSAEDEPSQEEADAILQGADAAVGLIEAAANPAPDMDLMPSPDQAAPLLDPPEGVESWGDRTESVDLKDVAHFAERATVPGLPTQSSTPESRPAGEPLMPVETGMIQGPADASDEELDAIEDSFLGDGKLEPTGDTAGPNIGESLAQAMATADDDAVIPPVVDNEPTVVTKRPEMPTEPEPPAPPPIPEPSIEDHIAESLEGAPVAQDPVSTQELTRMDAEAKAAAQSVLEASSTAIPKDNPAAALDATIPEIPKKAPARMPILPPEEEEAPPPPPVVSAPPPPPPEAVTPPPTPIPQAPPPTPPAPAPAPQVTRPEIPQQHKEPAENAAPPPAAMQAPDPDKTGEISITPAPPPDAIEALTEALDPPAAEPETPATASLKLPFRQEAHEAPPETKAKPKRSDNTTQLERQLPGGGIPKPGRASQPVEPKLEVRRLDVDQAQAPSEDAEAARSRQAAKEARKQAAPPPKPPKEPRDWSWLRLPALIGGGVLAFCLVVVVVAFAGVYVYDAVGTEAPPKEPPANIVPIEDPPVSKAPPASEEPRSRWTYQGILPPGKAQCAFADRKGKGDLSRKRPVFIGGDSTPIRGFGLVECNLPGKTGRARLFWTSYMALPENGIFTVSKLMSYEDARKLMER